MIKSRPVVDPAILQVGCVTKQGPQVHPGSLPTKQSSRERFPSPSPTTGVLSWLVIKYIKFNTNKENCVNFLGRNWTATPVFFGL